MTRNVITPNKIKKKLQRKREMKWPPIGLIAINISSQFFSASN